MEQRIEKTERGSGTESNGAGTDVLCLYMSRARRHRLLSREEEAELSGRMRRGDESAFDELVRCNLKLVVSIARGYVGRGLELPDLIQEGNIGLMRAARGFDADFGNKFSTYATWWIKQAIGRAIHNKANMIRVPIHAAEEESRVRGARNHIQAMTGREPSVGEISAFVGKCEEEIEGTLAARKTVISYDVPIGADEEGFLSDLLADASSPNVEEQTMEDALHEDLRDLLATLPERERYVVERRYGLQGDRCATLKEVGDELGITRERVRQIEKSALRRLRSRAFDAELEAFLEPSLSPV